MNIDIVNKQVAKKLQVKETDVALINKFYWSKVREHIYSYNPLPINIQDVCVLYPTAYHTKKELLRYITAIRKLRYNNRFKAESQMRIKRMEELKVYIRKVWAIRKYNKWTN